MWGVGWGWLHAKRAVRAVFSSHSYVRHLPQLVWGPEGCQVGLYNLNQGRHIWKFHRIGLTQTTHQVAWVLSTWSLKQSGFGHRIWGLKKAPLWCQGNFCWSTPTSGTSGFRMGEWARVEIPGGLAHRVGGALLKSAHHQRKFNFKDTAKTQLNTPWQICFAKQKSGVELSVWSLLCPQCCLTDRPDFKASPSTRCVSVLSFFMA